MMTGIHGFSGTAAMWEGFADMYSLTVYGHDGGQREYPPTTFAEEVSRLADLLPRTSNHIVGYSMGARLSLAIALRYPKRVYRLTLIGVHPGLSFAKEQQERIARDRIWTELLRNRGTLAFVDAWNSQEMWASQSRFPQAQRIQRERRVQHNAAGLAAALEALGTGAMPAMWNGLPSLQMPVQLMVGALDAKFLAVAHRMIKSLPNASLSIVEGAGHNPVFENPQSVQERLRR